jgi:hypothetical protein
MCTHITRVDVQDLSGYFILSHKILIRIRFKDSADHQLFLIVDGEILFFKWRFSYKKKKIWQVIWII